MKQLSQSSEARIKRFVDCFIRSEYVANRQAEESGDFWNNAERAGRCYDAAEDGADGSTHYEIINDWRGAFSTWIRDKRLWTSPDRFITAVNDHFDAVESWHEQNGSLHQQLG